MTVADPHKSPQRSNVGRRGLLIARAALVLLSLFLVFRGIQMRGRPWLVDGPLWNLQQSSHLKALILSRGMAAIGQFLMYAIVGFLAVQRAPTGRYSLMARGRSLLWVLMFGIGLSALVSTAASGPGLRFPNLLDMFLPCVACLLGGWIGVGWTAGDRARGWIVAKLALLGVASLIAIAVLVLVVVEPKPLGFEPAELVSGARVRLTKLIRSKNPRAIPEGQTVTLSLTERDINLLMAWGLSLGSPERKARIVLADDHATIEVSIRLPSGDRSPQYLNLVVAGRVGVDEGILRLQIARLRVGRLSLPRPLLGLLSPALADKIQSQPLAVAMLAEIRETEITEEHISGTYGRMDMPEGFRNDVFGSIGPDEQVRAALSAQFVQITRLSKTLPVSEWRLGDFLEAAFRLAHDRSEWDDPVVENRAAIVALGISLGHDLIGEFVGAMPHEYIPHVSPPLTRRVKLRGRVDWSRHFLVSAALEVISSVSISLDAGVLKEEMDAGNRGGSGFSFADLAADRSGTRFGKVATRDAPSARAIQRRLRAGFNVDDYFPSSRDLPENISQQRLEAEYGGVNGEQYRRLLNEIDRRIAACAAYK